MIDMTREVADTVRRARALAEAGDAPVAIELLTAAARLEHDVALEAELVRIRRAEGARCLAQAQPGPPSEAITPSGSGGTVLEIEAAGLSVEALREGLAASGCLLVRGMLAPDRAAALAGGIDACLAAYDDSLTSAPVDQRWFDPHSMPDRVESGLTEDAHRAFLRSRGGFWTADSPRMLFELFELLDDTGLRSLLTQHLGERPLLSGIKATLRRVPPDVEVDGRWHQDGAFLGERISALNVWVALTSCGMDAPGLDVVPKRISHVVRDDSSRFDWSLSDAAVLDAAGETAILRPRFEAGDALLFDQLLVHRTGASPGMHRARHAIESWFFAPSAYPVGQLPIYC